MNKKQVIHLINFKDASILEWRDTKQIQKEPAVVDNIKLRLETKKPIAKMWYASPDLNKGSVQKISFMQSNSNVTFTLPNLKYWDMVVIEYQ